MKMKNLLLLVTICIFSVCNGQKVSFKESLGGNLPEYGYRACQTYDKGYIAVGSTSSFTNGNTDVYVVKTDSNGTVEWSKNYGSPEIEVGRYVEELSDSSLIIVGYTNSNTANGYDIYLLRLDRWGGKIWEKTIGGSDWEFGYCVHQTNDGNLIIAGGTYSYGAGNEDMYLVKTNLNGDTIWTKTYGGTDDDEARSVKQTSDGYYIVSGVTKSFYDPNGDAYVVKTNSSGDTLWTKSYGGAKADIANDIIECKNGDYALCGNTGSFSNDNVDFYVLRIKNDNSFIWDFHIGKDSAYDNLDQLVETASGNLACIGSTFGFSGGGGEDGYLQFLTASGNNSITNPTYGTGQDDGCFSIARTSDNGFIICGFTDTTRIGYNESNMLLIKSDSTGIIPGMKFLLSVQTISNNMITSVKTYPNPFSDETHLIINTSSIIHLSEFNLTVTDIIGNICDISYQITDMQSNQLELKLNKGNIKRGVYFIHYFFGPEITGVSKVIIE